MSLAETLQLVRDGGATTMLVLAVVGGFRGWYVWRWSFDAQKAAYEKEVARLEHDRDEWKAIALRGLAVAERITQ